jgi:glycosyltransferase involved in cell wall biosynthesis
MIKVLNLVDDTNIGGVIRGISSTNKFLEEDFEADIKKVTTRFRLPEKMDADIMIVDFTLSWAKVPYMLVLGYRFRGRLIVVEHSYTERYEEIRVRSIARFRLMLKLSFYFADKVVAVSKGQSAWMLKAKLMPSHKLVTITQSLDTSEILAIATAKRTEGPLRLGAYGRFVPQKGFDVLIEAMKLIPEHIANLTFAGYGPDASSLKLASRDLAHVRIMDVFTSPAEFLENIDVVVMPSRWEAYGLVGQETRAAGRPLIASNIDGLTEQVSPEWGLLIEPENHISLADAILEIAQKSIEEMGIEARKSVWGKFEFKIIQWRKIIREVHAGNLLKKKPK